MIAPASFVIDDKEEIDLQSEVTPGPPTQWLERQEVALAAHCSPAYEAPVVPGEAPVQPIEGEQVEDGKASRRLSCSLLWVLGCLVVVGGIVGGTVGGILASKSSQSSKSNNAPTAAPTMDETPLWTALADKSEAIEAAISSAGVTPLYVLTDPLTAQSQAMDWLIFQDDYNYQGEDSAETLMERVQQRYALVTLAFATNGDLWSVVTPWTDNRGVNECRWEGIECNNDDWRVTVIDLQGRNMAGELPNELVLLSQLSTLQFQRNELEGRIPESLYEMTWLEILWLADNEFNDILSTKLGQLTNLQRLSLENLENIQGTLPTELSKLTKLVWLSLLGTTNLSGDWVSILSQITTLERVALGDSGLTGSFGAALPLAWSGLKSLLLGNQNKGTVGSLPTEIGLWTELQVLQIDLTSMTGVIPTEVGLMTSLTTLHLADNDISGNIPTQVGALANLINLRLMRLDVQGPLPSELGNLENLKVLNLELSLGISGPIPTELGRLENLEFLGLLETGLTGEIPSVFCSWPTVLEFDCPVTIACQADPNICF